MGLLAASSLVFVALLGCSIAEEADPKKPAACANVQATGFFADKEDPKNYYWCHAGTNQGVKITCAPDTYQWSDEMQSCVPTAYVEAVGKCSPELPTVTDGKWSEAGCTQGEKSKTGTSCKITCDPGNYLTNEDERNDRNQLVNMGKEKTVTCSRRPGQNARWTLDVTKFNCRSKCDPNPCGFGTCTIENEKPKCDCESGWEQNKANEPESPCLTTKDKCEDFTCENNGYCVNGNPEDPAKCICAAGYTGDKCADKINCGNPESKLKLNDDATVSNIVNKDADYDYGSTATLTCKEGFWVKDSEKREVELTCGQSGNWEHGTGSKTELTNAEDACVPVNCGVPLIEGAESIVLESTDTPIAEKGEETQFGAKAILKCVTDTHRPEPEGSEFSCQADGTWGPQTCVAKICGDFPAQDNADITGSGNTVGSKRTITCKTDYATSSGLTSGEATCRTNGEWVKAAPFDISSCVTTDCGDPATHFGPETVAPLQLVWKSRTKPDPVPQGETVTLSCDSPNMVLGANTLTCGPNGWDWEDKTVNPRCSAKKCPINYGDTTTGGSITYNGGDGTAVASGVDAVTKITVTCSNGYVVGSNDGPLLGVTTMSYDCQEKGEGVAWISSDSKEASLGSGPKCAPIPCPKLGNPTNGEYSQLEGHYEQTSTITCKENLVINPIGTKELTCTAAGTWSPDPGTITCEEVRCNTIEVANARVVKEGTDEDAATFPIEGKFQFKCNEGYESSQPAEYTVTCQKNGDSKIGVFDKAFPTCSNINDCTEANKAKCNNGECVDGVNDFKCICNAGYEDAGDEKCKNPTDPCKTTEDKNPCLNGATCALNTGYDALSTTERERYYQYICNCQPADRYSGYNCQKDNQDTSFTCTGKDTGKHADPRSCVTYYYCFGNNAPVSRTCAPNGVFDEGAKECVPKDSAGRDTLCTKNNGL